jgi:hypothetical protein
LAREFGGDYTRYADDLLFSGDQDLARSARRFCTFVCAIALEEGFRVNMRKQRIMGANARQCATGLVLNEKPNIPRRDFKVLKAILHNCVQHGPQSQNRGGVQNYRTHLAGRIGYVESIHPARGALLRTLFERIRWEDGAGM